MSQINNYPRCSDVKTLESLPHLTIVRLTLGWSLQRNGYNDSATLIDPNGDRVSVYKVPTDYDVGISYYNTEIHVQVSIESEDIDQFNWANPHASYKLFYYEPKQGKCTCGAAYTTFKDRHYQWCDSLDVK